MEQKENSSLVYSSLLQYLEELNHDIRTPLGVALMICRDGRDGREVSARDFLDAVSALERVKSKLDDLKALIANEKSV